MTPAEESVEPRNLEVGGQIFVQKIISYKEKILWFCLEKYYFEWICLQAGKAAGNGSLLYSRTWVPSFVEQYVDNRGLLLQIVPCKLLSYIITSDLKRLCKVFSAILRLMGCPTKKEKEQKLVCKVYCLQCSPDSW